MKEVWSFYEEAFTEDSKRGFTRRIRTFDAFEKAKVAMAERIKHYAQTCNNGDLNIMAMAKNAIYDEDLEFGWYSLEDAEEDMSETVTEAYSHMERFFINASLSTLLYRRSGKPLRVSEYRLRGKDLYDVQLRIYCQ